MTSVGMRGRTRQDKAPKMGTLSPISPLKTSLICSSGEATRQVSASVLCFPVTLFNHLPQHDLPVCSHDFDPGNANVYNDGRMRYQRRERRERQRDVSRCFHACQAAEGDIEPSFIAPLNIRYLWLRGV